MPALDRQQDDAERRRVLRRRLLSIIGTDPYGQSVWMIERGLHRDGVFMSREALHAELHYLIEKGQITELKTGAGMKPRWAGVFPPPAPAPRPGDAAAL